MEESCQESTLVLLVSFLVDNSKEMARGMVGQMSLCDHQDLLLKMSSLMEAQSYKQVEYSLGEEK